MPFVHIITGTRATGYAAKDRPLTTLLTLCLRIQNGLRLFVKAIATVLRVARDALYIEP
jgi:hypothetical protein